MTIRVRSKSRPNDDSKDIPCEPAHAQRHAWNLMRRTIDEQLIAASAHHRREVMR